MKLAEYRKRYLKEKDCLEQGIQLLRLCGCVVWRQNTGAAKYQNKDGTTRYVSYGIKGMPDVVGYMPKALGIDDNAIPIYWEAKRPGGRVRPEQKNFIQNAKQNGCFAVIGTLDDLTKEMKLRKWA